MHYRSMSQHQRMHFLLAFVSVSLGLATCFTLFYFGHEQLPRFARAPSALLLAPVAIVDGLCHAAGVPGIYGKVVPIFTVNFTFAVILFGLGYFAAALWRGRNI